MTMTHLRSPFRPLPRHAAVLMATLLASGAVRSVARADDTCSPPCAAGQVCYQRTCMVPAPAAAPAPVAPSPGRPPVGYPPAQPPAYGYPPQQPQPPGYGYPPSGYSATPAPAYPARQYPAQPYPQQQYPQQQYPQQPYPQQQYPQQQYPQQQYPQQQYPQQPYGYQQPPPPPPRRSRFLALPYIGVSTFLGDQTRVPVKDRSLGGRVGALLGFRLSPVFSLAGELSVDVLQFRDNPDDLTGVAFVLAAVPQFHVVAPSFELVFGPKIGIWGESIDSTYLTTSTYYRYKNTASSSGFLFGVNAGIFFPVGRRLSIGGLLSFDLRPFNRICYDSNEPGIDRSCVENDLPDMLKVLGIAGALLF